MMKPKFKFEKLRIWQESMDLADVIDLLTKKFPKNERFNLNSQIRRAADSVALNISEGSIGQSNLEQKKILGHAIRSLAEVVTCLHKAKRRKYITFEEFNKYYNQSFHLMNMTVAFSKNIK